MKIGFLTSYRGQKKFERQYHEIVAHLKEKDHEVIHHLNISINHVNPLGPAERDALFMKFYHELEDCELIFVDASNHSTQVGFGLSYLNSKGKPIVLLYSKNANLESFAELDIYSKFGNVTVYEYDDDEIRRVLDDALSYMAERIDKRFTMIFPSTLFAKIEEVSKKRSVPKSVYIRQLVEEDIRKNG